jgi:UDP-glucose 4-epimerase
LLVKRLAKSGSEINYIPYEQAYGENYVDVKRRKPDLTKLFSYLNFKYCWKLEDSICDLIEKKTSAS